MEETNGIPHNEPTGTPAGIPRPGIPQPWALALIILLITIGSFMIVAPLIGLLAAYPFYEGSFFTFLEDVGDPVGKEQMKMISYFVQGVASFIGLAILPPYFYKRITQRKLMPLFTDHPVPAIWYLATALLVIAFVGPNSIFIDWNAHIDLPDGPFEESAKAFEEKAGQIITFLTQFNNVGQFLAGLLVIAVLAGVGEELVFRGLLQPELQKMFRNPHVGIWAAAILFSGFHLQLYGFVPRVLLGALFGYLYYWSGNLVVAMFAHFMNNAMSVIAVYIGMSEVGGVKVDSTDALPWPAIIVMTIVTVAILYIFPKKKPEPRLDS